MDVLAKYITNIFPKRQTILIEAINAHKNKQYCSSIVLFLSQIDGISKEITNKHFFMNREWEKENLINNIENLFASAFLKVFKDFTLPIKSNRHKILHGEILDYNSEINSLKTFSLLIAISIELNWLKQFKDDL